MQGFNLAVELSARQSLIVHFSHHANMRAGGIFPNDMHDAIENRNEWVLSCCAVWPGHNMDLPGSVGVVFNPSPSNVVSVSNSDSGSSTDRDGAEQSAGVPLSPHSFHDSFRVAGAYNEWRLLGAEVVGIFVANPHEIYTKREVVVPFEGGVIREISAEPVSLGYVLECFPQLRVFTMSGSVIIELDGSTAKSKRTIKGDGGN
jgi:hypothetical protein